MMPRLVYVFSRATPAVALALGVMLLLVVHPSALWAQGNLSTQGFGYPTGQLSTSSLGAGGGLGEFDPESSLNPAAIASLTRPMIHLQFDPEFRSVSTPAGTDHTTTMRFPLLSAGLPISSSFVLGLSFSRLLDRTWESTQTGLVAVGDTSILSSQTFKVTGGIENIQVNGAWTPLTGLRVGFGLHAYTGQNQITVQREFADTAVVKALAYSETSTINYLGEGISIGIDARPSPLFAIAASAELGGALRAHRNDTLLSKGSVPPRVGASIRYDGVAGLTLAARGEWQGWSQLGGLGSPAAAPHDAWDFGGGAEIVGPKVAERGVVLRIGAETRTLPFVAGGAVVRENDITGGLGIPLGGLQRAALDLAVRRALRTTSVLGISEDAWMLSLGITVRP